MSGKPRCDAPGCNCAAWLAEGCAFDGMEQDPALLATEESPVVFVADPFDVPDEAPTGCSPDRCSACQRSKAWLQQMAPVYECSRDVCPERRNVLSNWK